MKLGEKLGNYVPIAYTVRADKHARLLPDVNVAGMGKTNVLVKGKVIKREGR
jgi:hypothetical protein